MLRRIRANIADGEVASVIWRTRCPCCSETVAHRDVMRALLIWPKFESFSFWNFEEVCKIVGVKYMTPPLGLLTLAAMLPPDWEVSLVDENVRPLQDSDLDQADLVLVGSKIVHRDRALAVIARARAAGKRVIVGGPDPTLSPDRYLESGADALCVGEAEVVIPEILRDLESGTLQPVYRAERLADLEAETPAPRFDLIDHRDYLYIGVQYSRGCPHHCEFCNVIDLFPTYRTKSIAQVLAELDALYAVGYRGQVDFFDDNMVGNFKAAKPLLRAIADWLKAHRYPFQLSTSVTLNVAKDSELLDLLREARFKYFLVGIETPDEAALKKAQKPQNIGFSVAEAADRIYRRAGATVHSGFLLGLDGEPPDIADRMLRCIDEASIPWVMAGVVYPLPGTGLARRLQREGRLFPRARDGIAEGARDQISAGLQFVPERSPLSVIDDLNRVMHHAFDPREYFSRCAGVATRLNTIPNLVPGLRLFVRNVRTFLRLTAVMLRSRELRRPYFGAMLRVLRRNRAGLEAFVTLSVLYMHFRSMLPYVYGELEKQREEITRAGEAEWLRGKLNEPSLPPARSEFVELRTSNRGLPAAVARSSSWTSQEP